MQNLGMYMVFGGLAVALTIIALLVPAAFVMAIFNLQEVMRPYMLPAAWVAMGAVAVGLTGSVIDAMNGI